MLLIVEQNYVFQQGPCREQIVPYLRASTTQDMHSELFHYCFCYHSKITLNSANSLVQSCFILGALRASSLPKALDNTSKMADILKFNIMAVIMAFTLVAATPVERERRFLVDSIIAGATVLKDGITNSIFRVFGLKFRVKDKSQTLAAADAIRGYGHTIHNMGNWYTKAAEGYRRSMYHQDAYRHLNEWETAANLLTNLGDEMSQSEKYLIHSTTWIRLSITAPSMDASKADQFKDVLDTMHRVLERLEDLTPKAKVALNRLRDVTVASVTDDIDKTLNKVAKTHDILARARDKYDSLVKAVGFSG
ncbi:hypothetical protein RRG08_059086 [Elysia crispata]|uniref:Uncharacterized protein n=1 Tax=Elysia crispata TaxID=231223 RepID=A0AAE1B7S9_9GAST|nr:hypothetical protein RRG08_059086 [Elysia crispata]